ncbi:MAG: DUF3108 domain-containing protein [marine benthic group bacterium]|nr:DUF3108 domain-containing protein [Candidatus Benthicola marisminoris]
MLKKSATLAYAGLLLVAGGLQAQDRAAVCNAVGNATVGDWSSYEFTDPGNGTTGTLRFAVINRDGSDSWYEMQATTPEGEVVIQMSVPGFPFTPDQVTEVIFKAPGQPAMRLPAQMLGMMKDQMAGNPMFDFAEQCAAAEDLGTETVEVPAGSFDAIHIRNAGDEGEAWISLDVPFGMIKAEGEGTIVLTGYGDDAVSTITEEPQTMPGMGG